MKRIFTIAVFASLLCSGAMAEEGLWLFNVPPAQKIKSKYGFTLTDAWLNHVRESSVRFNSGGSGSFVSPNGLAFTNHHIASDCLQKISTKEKDYIKNGFYAKTWAEEAKCPDMELNVLIGIEDVTQKVLGAANPGMTTAEAGSAQRSAMSALESECAKGGARCDVVTLYSGGMYHLYRYRRFMDVRLVFAPEYAIASFGGDPDNFEFPRWALDTAFFRVYENDKPVNTKQYLKWSPDGVGENDLVFMSGHPGSTARLNTMSQLRFLREVQYPWALKTRGESIKLLQNFSAKSRENARIAHGKLYNLQNGQKSLQGYYNALLDRDLMASKQADEEILRNKLVRSDPSLVSAWDEIKKAMETNKEIFTPYTLLERMGGFDSELAGLARTLVRVTAEKQKPNAERLRDYRESNLTSLEQQLFSTAPIYDSVEVLMLTQSLARLHEKLRADNTIKRTFDGKTPAEIAKRLISGTKLKDVGFRKKLYEGGWDAVSKSDDPLIVLMRDIDPGARAVRKRYEDHVEAVVRREAGRIAQARFKVGGDDLYPDATFTLRLSYGTVRGYVEDGKGSVVSKGSKIPYYTTMGGAFEREAAKRAKDPWVLPPSWKAAKQKMKLKTPIEFVSTADSIGGNSGSPIVNTAGEIVGINFDRNMQGLGRNFYYSEEGMRHIAVDSRGILEALRSVYGATALANELTGTALGGGK